MMKSARYGLIGEKLGHSYSKLIHSELCDYDYQLMSIPTSEIEAFLSARDFAGLNVTIPYKKTVIPHCDLLTDAAKQIGSVNTLLMQPDGRLLGDNTDYTGFLYLARKIGVCFQNKKVLVLGSGGTSLTVQTAAKNSGAREVIIVSRGGEVNYSNIYDHSDADIIVNTTPVGMYPNNGERLVSLAMFPNLSGVIDAVYNPLYTALLLQAKQLGIPCGGGLSMLVAQAKYAAERFADRPIDDAQIEVIEQKLRKKLTNLILVGMPGSGKTTLSARCAKALERDAVEIDDLIIIKAGMSIPEIFASRGEDGFRALETEVINEVGKQTGLVISTGGGAVLREQNIGALKQNGLVAWVERPLEQLATEGRPLSKNIDVLKTMWEARQPIYRQGSDFAVRNDGEIEKAVADILNGFYMALQN